LSQTFSEILITWQLHDEVVVPLDFLIKTEIDMNKKMTLSGLVVAMFLSAGLAVAADQTAVQEKIQVKTQDREQVQTQQTVGRAIMTDEERNAQRAKMRSSTTREERKKIRAEHHKKMKERAKEQGVTIPDNPPERGQGGGQGGGMGGGQGGGMGGGQGGGMGGGGR